MYASSSSRSTVFVLLLTLSAALPPAGAQAKPAPGAAGTLSLVPGLGQVSNGDSLEGLGWFVSSVGLFFSGNTYASNIGFKIWMYNMYDAYRDAGGAETAKQSAATNYVGFLNPLNLIDPYSVGIIGVATASAYGTPPDQRLRMGPRSPVLGALYYGFTGWGEEALFRGFLYPGFSKLFSSHLAGAATSSALFAAAHLGNPQGSYRSGGTLAQLFIFGLLWCAQASYNRYDLRHNVFSHTWFDFMLDYGGGRASSTAKAGGFVPVYGVKLSVPLPI